MTRQVGLFTGWLISIAALLGSLYGSEMLHLPICHLCWYQRVCFYPLTIILGIGAYMNDKQSAYYALPLAIAGSLIAGYQTLLQFIPSLSALGTCGQGPSCRTIHMALFGFITYPLISMTGGVLLVALLVISYRAPSD